MTHPKKIKEGELVGLRFGLMNDVELERRSAFSLSQTPNQCKKNYPTLDSVTDPRLGTTQSNVACSKCALGALECQGHLAHIDLTFPCAIGAFLPHLDIILTCFCYRCSALLVPESNAKLKQLRKINVPETMGYEKASRILYIQALKTRVCGEQLVNDLLSPSQALRRQKRAKIGCGALNPMYWVRLVDVLLRPVWNIETPPKITMETIYSMLKNVKDEDASVIGFNSPVASLSALVVKKFIIAPLLIRPPRNRRSVDDLTDRLENIVRINKVVADNPRSGNLSITTFDTGIECHGTDYFECIGEDVYEKEDRPRRSVSKKPLIPRHLAMLFELQRQIAGFTFSKLNQKKDLDYGRIKGCVSDKFTASANGEHKGIMKGSLMSKRADLSARAPVSPDTDIPFDCIGVPVRICKALTIEEVVTKLNYTTLLSTVLRGDQYPGANRITRNGVDYQIPGFAANGLQIGDIVHRHLRKGDWVIVNRQPTLHRYSLMALRLIPMFKGSSFRISLCLTVAYAHDYDGDEFNMLVLPNEKAAAEGMILMAAGENMYRNGGLIIQLVQHAALGCFLLTKETTVLTRDVAYQLLMISGLGDYIFQRLEKATFPISGREFLSKLLGKMFYDGLHQLKKSAINVILGNVIRWYGDGVDILSGYCRLFETFAQMSGTSLSYYDLFVHKPQTLLEEVNTILMKVDQIETESMRTNANDFMLSYAVEDHIKKLLDKARDIVGKHVNTTLRQRSLQPLLDITESGAKGDLAQVIQNAGMLGQQLTHSSNRLPILSPHVITNTAFSRGFVSRSFAEGLNSLEFYGHVTASRGALVDTTNMIKRSGYLFKRMCKSLEDCEVSYDNSVRTKSGLMILSSFGFETTFSKYVEVQVMKMSIQQVKTMFYFPFGKFAEREVEALLATRDRVLFSKHLHKTISLPIQWNMLKYVLEEKYEDDNNTLFDDDNIHDFADLIRIEVTLAWSRMVTEYYLPSIDLLRLSYQENMSVYNLVCVLGMKKPGQLKNIIYHVIHELTTNLAPNGTPIGPLVSEDFCAPVSQMSLKSFHYAGLASELAGGLERIEEILTLSSKISTPSHKLYPKDTNFNAKSLIQIRMVDITRGWLDHAYSNTNLIENDNDLVICCLLLDKDKLIDREISPSKVCTFVKAHPQFDSSVQVQHCNLQDNVWWICLYFQTKCKFLYSDKKRSVLPKSSLAANAYHKLTIGDSTRLLAGVRNITDVFETEEFVNTVSDQGELVKTKYKVIITRGTNLFELSRTDDPQVTHHKNFFTHLTTSNDIINEIYQLYGIDAACKAIENELVKVMIANGASVARGLIRLISSFMCCTGVPRPLTFAGMIASNTNKLKLCTHERVLKGFLDVGCSAHRNNLTGTSESIMMGRKFALGTGAVRLIPRKGDIYRTYNSSNPMLTNIPLPPIENVAMEITFPENSRMYFQKGPQKPLEVVPVVNGTKKRVLVQQRAKSSKTKKSSADKKPRRSWKKSDKKKETKQKLKEEKPKIKTPKSPKKTSDSKWSYASIFLPSSTPEHD